MKKCIVLFLCCFTITTYAQNKLRPQKVTIEFTCNNDVNTENVIAYLISCNLPEFKYSIKNNEIQFSAKIDLDSSKLQTLYKNKVLFKMYPLITLPEPTPIFTSQTIDEETANQILVSEYVLGLQIPMICSTWKNEYLSMEETIYKYYMYDCSENSLLDSTDISGITIGLDRENNTSIELRFTKNGQQRFYDATLKHINKQLVFMISNYIFSAPTVLEGINTNASWITGLFGGEMHVFISNLLLQPYLNDITISSITLK